MLNRFKIDEFFLSNICLTSADKKNICRVEQDTDLYPDPLNFF